MRTDSTKSWFKFENKKGSDKTDIYIYDEIGFWGVTAQDFVDQLREVDSKKITVHVNSPGGAIFDGIAIYNALKQHPAEVTVTVDALAASAASFIAQAGDVVQMSRNATMMIHDGMGICLGNAADMRETAVLLDRMSNNIADIYAQRAGGDVGTWRAFMQAETWYTGQEAVDAGLADEVVGETPADAEEAKNNWDLSFFNYAGRDKAPSPEHVRQTILKNTAKEAPVSGTTKNQGGEGASGTPATPAATPPNQPGSGTPEDPGTGSPDTDPDAKTTEGSKGEPADASTNPPAGTPGGATSPTPTAQFAGVLVNGTLVQDPTAVQNHVNSLENFRKETLEAGRKSFVKNLCDDKKIAATQVEATETFALGLTDVQYTQWVASWQDAPPVPVFGQHAAGSTNHDGTTEADPAAVELQNAKDIVRQHRLANMSQENLEKTASWAVLVKHNATDSV
jgi:ATP-dependent protease ClpP protease subunit